MRRAVSAFAFAAAWAASSPPARASVSLTVVFDALVEESTAAAVVTPIAARSVWEAGRIVTYTHVRVDETLAGAIGADAWLRTLGGEIGDVGQQVEGEATFESGRRYVVFVKPQIAGSMSVVSRAQGEFPLEANASRIVARLRPLPLPPRADAVARARQRAPEIAQAAMPAATVLAGQSMQDARVLIQGAWARTHAPR